MARFDLTDAEWAVIAPVLPADTRGVERVDDGLALNGIFWRLRTGAPWADIPAPYGPQTTCTNRFRCWRKAGVWDRLLDAVLNRRAVTATELARVGGVTSATASGHWPSSRRRA